jgi:hypothetical protein
LLAVRPRRPVPAMPYAGGRAVPEPAARGGWRRPCVRQRTGSAGVRLVGRRERRKCSERRAWGGRRQQENSVQRVPRSMLGRARRRLPVRGRCAAPLLAVRPRRPVPAMPYAGGRAVPEPAARGGWRRPCVRQRTGSAGVRLVGRRERRKCSERRAWGGRRQQENSVQRVPRSMLGRARRRLPVRGRCAAPLLAVRPRRPVPAMPYAGGRAVPEPAARGGQRRPRAQRLAGLAEARLVWRLPCGSGHATR